MRSVIMAETHSKCVGCGATSFVQEYFNKIEAAKKDEGIKVPKCVACKNFPNYFLYRRSLPVGMNGKSERVEIRWDKDHKRLTDIFQVIALVKIIDNEIKTQSFNPAEYRSKKHDNQFSFENFVFNTYWPVQEMKLKRQEMTPSGLTNKSQSIKHLLNFFAGVDIRAINTGLVTEFNDTYEASYRVRALALQELRVILNYANGRERLKEFPIFPKMKKAKVRDGENFLSYKEQCQVVSAIEDQDYKKMIEVMAIYALRTCEIRALQWQDLDFRTGIIKIQRHFSRNKLIDMRKSNDKPHLLPMTERFIEIMQTVTRSFSPDEFVFKGKEGSSVGEKVLSNAWKKAIIKTGMRSIDLYEGIRHSRVSALLEKGYSEDQVMLLSGHETKDAFKRYGQIKAQSKLNLIKEMMG
jgi:integrase